ncbi:MAG: DegT/DnrJ/EryC1/StrS family aminotransferase [Oceanicaulis sp.]|nr:DegT/DnrJ/EryC1/StrS family aminotransferase [Oceanicaulis sp.]
MSRTGALALLGGAPVRTAPWPAWPPVNDGIRAAARSALDSGRWAISGPVRGGPSLQQQFAQAWAAFNGVGYGVAVSSGSSALLLAMEALGIGPGDEVIVPVWTWVASASTVLRAGATPVLADVSPDNFCLTAASIARAITPRTRAVIGVHLHQSMMEMEPILELTRARGLYLIEDCAQAHGALYAGRRAGSFGHVGCFSFQQTKPLTSGEGGAVITHDPELAERVFALHADGRRLARPDPVTGLELAEGLGPMGANHAMTEMQAAVLLAQLEDSALDKRLSVTAQNAAWLDEALAGLGPLRPLIQPARLERRTVFEYIIALDPSVTAHVPSARIGVALSAELGAPWYTSDPPLHVSGLYRPGSRPRFAACAGPDRAPGDFPVAEDYAARTLACHHAVLSAGRADMADIVNAFDKVLNRLGDLEADKAGAA